jgi:hypothetical protein
VLVFPQPPRAAMHDPTVPPRHVNFGPFELDVRSGELRKGATRLKVPDQSIEILKALVKHLGELVTREDHRFESKAFRDELSRALESLGYQLRTDAATHPWLSVGLILCELVHPLVREPEQSRSITGAHLQPASPQDTHRTSSGLGRASIFVVGALLRSAAYVRSAFAAPEGSLTSSTIFARRASATNSSIASTMRRRASSTVRPCVWHPRTPRTEATHQPDSSRSYATR